MIPVLGGYLGVVSNICILLLKKIVSSLDLGLVQFHLFGQG